MDLSKVTVGKNDGSAFEIHRKWWQIVVDKLNKRREIYIIGPGFTIKQCNYIICKNYVPSQIVDNISELSLFH